MGVYFNDLSRVGAYLEKNKELFEAQRRATDKCNTVSNELDALAHKMFHTSQLYGMTAEMSGRMKAYADMLASMSMDLLRETD